MQVLALTSEKGKGGQEIPIPVVTEVASYSRDYLPTYRERPVYVRGRGEITLHQCVLGRLPHVPSVCHNTKISLHGRLSEIGPLVINLDTVASVRHPYKCLQVELDIEMTIWWSMTWTRRTMRGSPI